MKKYKIFFRTFIICAFIGIILDLCFGNFKLLIDDIIGGIIIDILLAVITTFLCMKVEKTIHVEKVRNFINKVSIQVDENEDVIVGKLNAYKAFFMGGLLYDKKSGVLSGPRIILNKIYNM